MDGAVVAASVSVPPAEAVRLRGPARWLPSFAGRLPHCLLWWDI